MQVDRATIEFAAERHFIKRKQEYNLCALSVEEIDDPELKEQLVLRDKLIEELKQSCKEATQKVSSFHCTCTLTLNALMFDLLGTVLLCLSLWHDCFSSKSRKVYERRINWA